VEENDQMKFCEVVERFAIKFKEDEKQKRKNVDQRKFKEVEKQNQKKWTKERKVEALIKTIFMTMTTL
jgi:hypothetical protein